MDGVVTDTAQLHAQCWKEVLDALLHSLADETGQPFRPFTIDDYSRYVDGRPRYDGAAAFLAARQVSLEGGDPSDPPGLRTVCGLGNLKALRFEDALAAQGVAPFESTTLTEKLKLPVLVGVPVMAPVDAFRVKPAGSAPAAIEKV